MLSRLLEILMSDEMTPEEKSLLSLAEGIVLALLFAAVEHLDNLGRASAYFFAAVLFQLAIAYRKRLKLKLQERFSPIVLGIEKIARDSRYRMAGLFLVALIIGLTLALPVLSLKRNMAIYVLPRELTAEQVRLLRDYLAKKPPYSVTVKVNPLDQ
jgi:hypothetical protein